MIGRSRLDRPAGVTDSSLQQAVAFTPVERAAISLDKSDEIWEHLA